MAESSWPSPSNGRVVDDVQFEKFGISLGPYNGVHGDFTSPQMIYGDSSGRQFKVAADRYALVRGHVWWSGSSIITVPIAANASGSTRVDLVVLRLSRTTWDVNLTVIQGTPGAGAPTSQTQGGTTGAWDLTLALVTVASGASTISAGNVQYVAAHLDPGGGRLRVPSATYPWSVWSTFPGSEVLDANGTLIRWTGATYATIQTVERVAAASLTADSAVWTTVESGSLLSVVAPLISGWKYAVKMFTAVSTTVGGGTEYAVMRVRQDTAAGTQVMGPQVTLASSSTVGFAVYGYAEFTAVSTANKTFVLTGERNGGTGNHQVRAGAVRPTWLIVDRIG